MAILSKRLMTDVGRTYYRLMGVRPHFMDLSGGVLDDGDALRGLPAVRRKRDYALQESLNMGEPSVFSPAPGVTSWMLALEDRRMIQGGLIGGEVRTASADRDAGTAAALGAQGMPAERARHFVNRLPQWPESRVGEAAQCLQATFYQISGWTPELMRENRLRVLQQNQITQAIEDQRKCGKHPIYAFEKERILLACIRAGDRNGARSVLNEMLASIYMSSRELVVLRARTIELMSCLTRAAIEDNPLLEPLIERNHAWAERLVTADRFEDLSRELMTALDDFIDGIYLHGVNRSNTKVSAALEFIRRNYTGKISLRTVAAHVGLSPCRLAHLVKECTGRTVLQIAQQARIRHAQQLLERTSRTCTEIAYDVGYADQSYFIRHFRRLVGTTPLRYRRNLARATPGP